jgi:hypothetical protein
MKKKIILPTDEQLDQLSIMVKTKMVEALINNKNKIISYVQITPLLPIVRAI